MKYSKQFSTLFLVAGFVSVALLGAPAHGAEEAPKLPPPADKQNVTYAADIRPLFERSCFKCHGEEKQKAKLRLDSLEVTLKGTEKTKVVIPGKSADSELVKAIAHTSKDEDHWMPPEGKAEPLTPEEIGMVRAWIDQGAK